MDDTRRPAGQAIDDRGRQREFHGEALDAHDGIGWSLETHWRPTSSWRRHAVSCRGATRIKGGGALQQSSITKGQRGAKAQPVGRLASDGGCPAMEARGCRNAPPRGTEFKRPSV